MPRLYLDNNSTTPMLPEVAQAMLRYHQDHVGNPASAHRTGAAARTELESARASIARHLDAHPDEVIFTSGATEANNLALFSLAGSIPARSASEGGSSETKPPCLLASTIEHPSVIEPCKILAQQGLTLIDLPVDSQGHARATHPGVPRERGIITLQLANHETGVIQNIKSICQRFPNIAFHTDATQAVGKTPVHFHELGVTTLACSAHKFHGPPGIGVLLVNRCTRLTPRQFGGHQQQSYRPGTEAVPLAVGMATALKLAVDQMEVRRVKCLELRKLLLNQLTSEKIHFIINGDPENGLPHTLNLAFPGCASETLFIRLDLAGIDCSTGSACSSGSMLPSPVLQAMQVPQDVLQSSMRFSLSHLLSETEVIDAAGRIAREVKALTT